MPDTPSVGDEPERESSDPIEPATGSVDQTDSTEPVAAPRTSRLAIASAVTSVASIVLFFPLLAVIGAALGFIAFNRIRASGAGGLRWAVAGIVIGLVALVILILLVAVGPDPKPAA